MKRRRKRRLPNDYLILIIIAELFAVSFSCNEIYNESNAITFDRRSDAVSDTCVAAIHDPMPAVQEGIEAYQIAWEEAHRWKGPVLSRSRGAIQGPSGKETYYNLNMSGVVSIMRNMGYTGEYWVRDDGCKMLGEYIMVAANLNLRPRGTLVETSLGMGIVCDTGGFARRNPTQLDIATNW